MKSAATQDGTEFILYEAVSGSRAKPIVLLQYLDDDGVWQYFEDVTQLSYNTTNDNLMYGKVMLVPSTNSLSCTIDNSLGKYSPDTGLEFDGVLVRNRRVRAVVGYTTSEEVELTYSVNLSGETLEDYHTQVISAKIYNAIASEGSKPQYSGITDDLVYYGDENYGGFDYQPEGFWISDVIDFSTVDTEVLKSISVTADTTGVTMYYRSAPHRSILDNDGTPFISLGNTINGTKSFTLPDIEDRWFQIAAVFSVGTWSSTSGYITTIGVNYITNSATFVQGEYLMDDPSFNMSYGQYNASFTARDWLKKAYETQVTCPSYSGGKDPALIIRDVCDRAGIPYTTGTIPATAYTVTIADNVNFKQTKAIDILNEIMQWLVYKDANYRLQLIDGYLTLTQLSVDNTTADWQIDYRYNIVNMSRGYVSDRLLQRVTYLNVDHTTNPESSLASTTHVAPVTNQDLTWASDSMYLRIVTSGGTFTLNYIDLNGKKINYDALPDSGGTFSIEVFGCVHSTAFTGYFGEAIYQNNAVNVDGFTQKVTNRLIQSDADAKGMAEAMISRYGNPQYTVSATIPCNPLLELGDRLLVWERYSNTNTVYRVDGIGVTFNANGAQFMQELKLNDLGGSFGSLIWDRNGATEGGNDLDYDTGLIWDQGLGALASSDTNTYTKPVRFS